MPVTRGGSEGLELLEDTVRGIYIIGNDEAMRSGQVGVAKEHFIWTHRRIGANALGQSREEPLLEVQIWLWVEFRER